ncbi:hypothetical protein [Scytonema millei]|uniref:Uncharacterized protein n=1 Tax=Scytonema millei VB511283 TaxID=1245923 RepID=A0A9X5E949_9CYAN|nr:hypothetical protein [Scytonema millei]NHC37068.1 hypothetical protein [Scytonema millei VB511283]
MTVNDLCVKAKYQIYSRAAIKGNSRRNNIHTAILEAIASHRAAIASSPDN